MTSDGTIVVYGATGLTGGLVVEALIARGATVAVAGRDATKLRALAQRWGLGEQSVIVADAHQPAQVARMVERARVVVSCAGPFMEVGEPIVAACAARGVFYTDSTGEATFVRMVLRRYDATARAQGCALAPSMAFEVSVGDAAAARAAEGLGENVDVEIAYSVSHPATSKGTRASIAMMLSQGSLAFVDGDVKEEPVAAQVRTVTFQPPMGQRTAVSFPSPEVLLVPRHVSVRSVRTFMTVPWPAVVTLGGKVLPVVAKVAEPVLRRMLERAGPQAPSPEQRARTRFQVVATARSRDGARTRRVTVSGSDPYRLSGVLLAEAAMAMASNRVTERGVVAPVQVLGVDGILERVRGFDGGNVTIESQ